MIIKIVRWRTVQKPTSGELMNPVFENLYTNKDLRSALFAPICERYHLTPTEILVLLFLYRNQDSDTAADMVERLKIAKSHISSSVRDLEDRGYLKGIHTDRDRRSIHLQLCGKSTEIIHAGERIQDEFASVICRGFSEEELLNLEHYLQRMAENIKGYVGHFSNGKGGISE